MQKCIRLVRQPAKSANEGGGRGVPVFRVCWIFLFVRLKGTSRGWLVCWFGVRVSDGLDYDVDDKYIKGRGEASPVIFFV